MIKQNYGNGKSVIWKFLSAVSIVKQNQSNPLLKVLSVLLKINHNETLTLPTMYDQTMFASVKQAFDMGCVAVGATIYFTLPAKTE